MWRKSDIQTASTRALRAELDFQVQTLATLRANPQGKRAQIARLQRMNRATHEELVRRLQG